MKIAIVGATPQGVAVAALLKGHYPSVTLFHVNHFIDGPIQVRGIHDLDTLTSQTMTISVQPLHAFEFGYDAIFIFSPEHENDSVLPIIRSHIKPSTVIVSFQENLQDDELMAYLQPYSVISATYHFQAYFVEQSAVQITTDAFEIKLHAFDLTDPISPQNRDILAAKHILDEVGQTFITEQTTNIKWSKALFNAAIHNLAKGLNCMYGDILHHPIALQVAISLADEVARTAHKNNIRLSSTTDINYNRLIIDSDSKMEELKKIFQIIITPHISSRPLTNYEPGVAEPINATIVGMAIDVDQPTPYNELLLRCLNSPTAIEFHTNIQLFEPLIENSPFQIEE